MLKGRRLRAMNGHLHSRISQRAATASSAARGDAYLSLAQVMERIYLLAPKGEASLFVRHDEVIR
jgi:hypothetical protein